MSYTLQTKIKELLSDDRVITIVTNHFGKEILRHPLLPLGKAFTIEKALKYRNHAPFPQDDIDVCLDEILRLD